MAWLMLDIMSHLETNLDAWILDSPQVSGVAFDDHDDQVDWINIWET